MIQFVLRKGPHDLWTCVYFTAECVASSADGQGIHGWAYRSAFHVVIVYWLKTWYQTCAVIYSPYIWLQKENVLWCKYLSIVKLAEQMSLTWTTGHFYLHFKRKKKVEKGFFICNCNGLRHDTKLVLTYSPYIWLQKEYVKWCKYLPFVKLAEQMSLTRMTRRF